jgi:hypothetical protein
VRSLPPALPLVIRRRVRSCAFACVHVRVYACVCSCFAFDLGRAHVPVALVSPLSISRACSVLLRPPSVLQARLYGSTLSLLSLSRCLSLSLSPSLPLSACLPHSLSCAIIITHLHPLPVLGDSDDAPLPPPRRPSALETPRSVPPAPAPGPGDVARLCAAPCSCASSPSSLRLRASTVQLSLTLEEGHAPRRRGLPEAQIAALGRFHLAVPEPCSSIPARSQEMSRDPVIPTRPGSQALSSRLARAPQLHLCRGFP